MRFITLVLILFTLACHHGKQAMGDEKKSESKSELLTKDSLSLSFERTLCFGTCPWYKITVSNDGKCLYEGFKFVDRMGKHTAIISKEDFDKIMAEAKRIGFFEMQDLYDASVTDVPSVIVMLQGENGKKEITDRFEAPEELKRFEKYIDSILLNLNWQKVD